MIIIQNADSNLRHQIPPKCATLSSCTHATSRNASSDVARGVLKSAAARNGALRLPNLIAKRPQIVVQSPNSGKTSSVSQWGPKTPFSLTTPRRCPAAAEQSEAPLRCRQPSAAARRCARSSAPCMPGRSLCPAAAACRTRCRSPINHATACTSAEQIRWLSTTPRLPRVPRRPLRQRLSTATSSSRSRMRRRSPADHATVAQPARPWRRQLGVGYPFIPAAGADVLLPAAGTPPESQKLRDLLTRSDAARGPRWARASPRRRAAAPPILSPSDAPRRTGGSRQKARLMCRGAPQPQPPIGAPPPPCDD